MTIAVPVFAQAWPPSGRRTEWLWLVVRCPYCSDGTVSSAHAHRGGPTGGVRRAGCGLGLYVLHVTRSHPATTTTGGTP